MKIKDPIEKKRLMVLNASLLIVFIGFVGGSYLLSGVDLAKGTLVGCVVVAINFFLSQRLVGQLILEGSVKPLLLIAYTFKLGFSILILFVAVVKWQLDVRGLMLGLSSFLFSVVISAFLRKPATPEDE